MAGPTAPIPANPRQSLPTSGDTNLYLRHHQAMLFSRSDGDRISDLPLLRRFMPYLMRGRNEAVVYLDQQIDVAGTLAWLERINDQRAAEAKITFYHVVLASLVRTLSTRERLNRFIVGGTVYQRRGITISFAVKKRFADAGKLTTVKVSFEATDTIEDVARRVSDAIGTGRGSAATTSEKEMVVVSALPGVLLRALMAIQRWADAWNLLPASMIEPDPLYASAFVANLGSIGLHAPFHHLFEYGTVPIFLTIGRIHKAPVVLADDSLGVGQVVHVKYSFDERIADGFYCARSLDIFAGLVASPDALTAPRNKDLTVSA